MGIIGRIKGKIPAELDTSGNWKCENKAVLSGLQRFYNPKEVSGLDAIMPFGYMALAKAAKLLKGEVEYTIDYYKDASDDPNAVDVFVKRNDGKKGKSLSNGFIPPSFSYSRKSDDTSIKPAPTATSTKPSSEPAPKPNTQPTEQEGAKLEGALKKPEEINNAASDSNKPIQDEVPKNGPEPSKVKVPKSPFIKPASSPTPIKEEKKPEETKAPSSQPSLTPNLRSAEEVDKIISDEQSIDKKDTQNQIWSESLVKPDDKKIKEVIEKPQFKKWFGHSVVANENGKPDVVYHATMSQEDFDEFSRTLGLGYHFGSASQAKTRQRNVEHEYGVKPRIASFFLSIKNPLELPDQSWDTPGDLFYELKRQGVEVSNSSKSILDRINSKRGATTDFSKGEGLKLYQEAFESLKNDIIAAGYDGVKYENGGAEGAGTSWIAFTPNQIKSVHSSTFTNSPKFVEDEDKPKQQPAPQKPTTNFSVPKFNPNKVPEFLQEQKRESIKYIDPENFEYVKEYTGTTFDEVNSKMRKCPNNLSCLSTNERKLVEGVEKTITGLPPFPKPVSTYRGIALSQEDSNKLLTKMEELLKSGGTYSFPTITSTSLDPEVALGGSWMGGGEVPILFRIKANTGLYTNGITTSEDEYELLKSHTTKYKVAGMNDADLGDGKQVVIYLEELPAKEQTSDMYKNLETGPEPTFIKAISIRSPRPPRMVKSSPFRKLSPIPKLENGENENISILYDPRQKIKGHNPNEHGNVFGAEQVAEKPHPPRDSYGEEFREYPKREYKDYAGEKYGGYLDDFNKKETEKLEAIHPNSKRQIDKSIDNPSNAPNDLENRQYQEWQASQQRIQTNSKDNINKQYEVKSYKDSSGHSYGALLYILPDELRKAIFDWCLENVPDFHLGKGKREYRHHITLVYGFKGGDEETLQTIKTILARFGPISLKLHSLSLFKGNGDGDVLKIDVDSPQLHELNREIKEAIPCKNKWPNYMPHVTICYIDPEYTSIYQNKFNLLGSK